MATSGSGTGTPIGGSTSAAAPLANPMPALPLETFRHHTGYNPWHFWQLSNSSVPLGSQCNGALFNYPWQHTDRLGRQDIRAAIKRAETRLRDYLGYSVAPHFVTETLPYSRYSGYVTLGEGYLLGIGTETLTLLDEDAALTYSDTDGDSLEDLFTLAVATTETDPYKIAVYFSPADRNRGYGAEDVGEEWRIDPVRVTISGGVATIRGKKWQTVKPIKYEGVGANLLDPSIAGNFATTLAVYVRSIASADATLISNYCYTCGCTNDEAGTASIVVKDKKLGVVEVCSTGYCHPPDSVTISYYAGWLPPDGASVYRGISEEWAKVVTYLALAELERPICSGQDNTNAKVWHYWQKDRSIAAGQLEAQFQISQTDLNNPLGTRAGQVYAWREIQNLRLARGVLAG